MLQRSAILIRFFLLILALLVHPLHMQAEPTPNETVLSLFRQLKDRGDFTLIVDFVYWPSVHDSLPEQLRIKRGIGSPSELRDFYLRFFRNPVPPIGKANEIDRSPIETISDRSFGIRANREIRAEHQNLLQEQHQLIKQTRYEIESTSIDKSKSIIVLIARRDDSSSKITVEMIKVGNDWLFASDHFLVDVLPLFFRPRPFHWNRRY